MAENRIRFLNYRSHLILSLSILFVVFAHSFSTRDALKGVFPEPVEVGLIAVSVAITEIEGEHGGYVSHRDTVSALLNLESVREYASSAKTTLPIITSFELPIRAAGSKHAGNKVFIQREDLGIVDFYKISFQVFGYHVDSFVSMYYLLYLISLLAFCKYYFFDIGRLNLILVIAMAHCVIVYALPTVGNDLTTVFNRRFLPILSIIPTLHLLLAVLDNKKVTRQRAFLLMVQIFIISFIFHCRSAAAYPIFVILTTAGWVLIRNNGYFWALLKYPVGREIGFILVCLLISIFSFKSYVYVHSDPNYSKVKTGHLFWHPAYLGLSAHPDAKDRYGIELNDIVTVDLVKRLTKERFGTDDWESFGDDRYFESVIKGEYIRILKSDPSYVVFNYAIKPYLFFKSFFSSVYWNNEVVGSFLIVIAIVIGSLMMFDISLLASSIMTRVLMIAGSGSFITLLFLSADNPIYIGEAALYFLATIYWIGMIIVGFVVRAAMKLR